MFVLEVLLTFEASKWDFQRETNARFHIQTLRCKRTRSEIGNYFGFT